ncbi:hypothetical protein PROFUN_14538 [Planoprotostelium fungivorum]|uniref:MULE transposase domain-containing protein n=1 Tax=Planoprotostelium fungivorum TaxID=1890364 RepID=A0A2P6N6M1_9EUKA|nr:hypothetical protein PROFUN_14538 [Planoprotostelium fungivorum]
MNNNDIIAPTDIEVAPHSNQAIDHVKAFSQNVVLETYEDCHFYDLDALGLKAPCQELISIAPELQVSLRPVDTSDGPQDKKRKKRTKEHFGMQKLPNNELLTMTEETVTTWRWQSNGKKTRKSDGATVIYYICSAKELTGCEAKFDPQSHCPLNVKPSAIVVKEAMTQLQYGVNSGTVHTRVTEMCTSQGLPCPDRRSIENMAVRAKLLRLPSPDAYVNLQIVLPELILIFMAQGARDLILNHGQNYVMVDGTFNYVEGRLILLTIMVPFHGKGIPAVWILCKSKTRAAYEEIFRIVYDLVVGDIFHFVQACRRKFVDCNKPWLHPKTKKSGRRSYRTCELSTCRSRSTSLKRIETIRTLFGSTQHKFFSYLQHQWVRVISPMKWIIGGRGNDVPTGDQQLEAWHRRLSAITSGTFEKIDHFSLRLWDEWSHWESVINNPVSATEALTRRLLTSEKSQRRTMTSYLPSAGAINNGKEVAGSSRPTPTPLLTDRESSLTVEEFHEPMEKDVVTSAGRSGDTPTSSQSSQQSSSALCPCGRSGNKDCRSFSGPLCSTCCGKASGFVCCYPHMTARNSHLPAIIDAAIEKGSTLKITYDSGQNKNRGARNIIPRGWRRNGKTSFNADDLTFSVEARHVSKTFKVAWIRSLEEVRPQ